MDFLKELRKKRRYLSSMLRASNMPGTKMHRPNKKKMLTAEQRLSRAAMELAEVGRPAKHVNQPIKKSWYLAGTIFEGE